MLRSATFENSGFISGNLLQPVSHWLESLEVREAKIAHILCRLIPAYCIFERDVKLKGKTLFHIPALCKLNPFYTQLIELRFRALSFLADECGEDVSQYCH
ncbi:Mo-dependent nitrogenase C-terminal domain-containing protein [Aerosakkonemataceae cyanobacterium BLCC-F154]|uniref:Mo-dependent nitrogenase C-terminal domain-containing protein n=1 Tax=Floridaenema fluviatile BLCC-F154 TaxID=3153640 RepID=A0ABV4YFY7_9CYAN